MPAFSVPSGRISRPVDHSDPLPASDWFHCEMPAQALSTCGEQDVTTIIAMARQKAIDGI
jgi:hypothetical protein